MREDLKQCSKTMGERGINLGGRGATMGRRRAQSSTSSGIIVLSVKGREREYAKSIRLSDSAGEGCGGESGRRAPTSGETQREGEALAREPLECRKHTGLGSRRRESREGRACVRVL